ncbi:MAG: hypothetical protein AABM42_12460 [Actinomycetota bacterium]
MRRIRGHLTYANVISTLCLFLLLSGGTAVALSGSNTVQSDDLGPGSQVKAPDVAANAVNGSDVLNNSLTLSDLNATSRPHKLEFAVPGNTGFTTIATLGHLLVGGRCPVEPAVEPSLFISLKNLTGQSGTMNALLTSQITADGAVELDTTGQVVGPGSQVTLDDVDSDPNRYLATGNFERVEGQVVFQTPGRVTTIDLHALVVGGATDRCEFYGTAVTSNLS